MKSVTIRSLLTSSVLVAMSSSLFAQHDASTTVAPKEEPVSTSAPFHAALPEGQTLPQGMFNPKLTTTSTVGDLTKFSSTSGKTLTSQSEDKVFATLDLRYGVTNRLTVALRAPFLFQNEIKNDGKTFLKGDSGFGDMELGALYNFYRTDKVLFSTGLGGRFPTGRYVNVKANELPTGNGSYDLGVQFNIDVQPVYGLWLSVQDRELMQVASLTRKLGNDQELRVKREDLSREGFVKANLGLGAMTQALKILAINGQYHYGLLAKAKNSETGKTVHNTAVLHKVGGGLVFDVRDYRIPASLELTYLTPVAGTNSNGSQTLSVALNAYL